MMQTSAVGLKKDFHCHQGFCSLLYSKEKAKRLSEKVTPVSPVCKKVVSLNLSLKP